jgi:hypothetical protein
VTNLDDTQPKVPKASHLDETGPSRAVPADETSPKSPTDPAPLYLNQQPAPPYERNLSGLLLMAGVLVLSSCMCLLIVGLFGVAGARDELEAVKTEGAQTRVSDLSTQYADGLEDIQQGNYAMAEYRFGAIVATMTDYPNAPEQLAEVQRILAYTPTPSPSPSQMPTLEATTEEAATPSSEETAAPPGQDPAELYARAESAMNAREYEDAILWFDALSLLDPTYRRADVEQGRLDAHIAQGRIYLRGQNDDGEDRLAQGIQLISRAQELGTVPSDLVYEAGFVARYVAARSYIEGGAFAQAREVLTVLCEEDCDWSYHGVSVRSLLAQAGG